MCLKHNRIRRNVRGARVHHDHVPEINAIFSKIEWPATAVVGVLHTPLQQSHMRENNSSPRGESRMPLYVH